ncbi:MAG: hypothetical protein HGA65_08850 [Oscillochloris sp.]|nr:hypothetical protein [Oscillochloris sp.]
MGDEFAPYERGLAALKQLFQQLMSTAGGPHSEAFLAFLSLEALLREHIQRARHNHTSNPADLLRERQTLILELNRLALSRFGFDFNSLCQAEQPGPVTIIASQEPLPQDYLRRSQAINLVQAYSQRHSQIDRQLQERPVWMKTVSELWYAAENDLLQRAPLSDAGYNVAELIAYALITASPNRTLLPDKLLSLVQRGLLGKQRARRYAGLYDDPRDQNFVIQRLDPLLHDGLSLPSLQLEAQQQLAQLEEVAGKFGPRRRPQLVNEWIKQQELLDSEEQREIEINLLTELHAVLQDPVDVLATEVGDLATMIVQLAQLAHPPVRRLSEEVTDRFAEMNIAWINHRDAPSHLLLPILHAIVTLAQKRKAEHRLAMPRVDLLDALIILAPAMKHHFPQAAPLIPTVVETVIQALP